MALKCPLSADLPIRNRTHSLTPVFCVVGGNFSAVPVLSGRVDGTDSVLSSVSAKFHLKVRRGLLRHHLLSSVVFGLFLTKTFSGEINRVCLLCLSRR